jgi:ssDNA-binding replication factor A large subunit
MLSGRGASIVSLRQQNDQYVCTASTKIINKDLEFRPTCVQVQSIENLRNNIIDGLCTIEVKVCEMGPEIPFIFEESDFKRVQKLKKTIIVGDKTGALELTLWETNFQQVKLGQSYQIKLVKCRLINFQISLSAVTDTSYVLLLIFDRKIKFI